MIVDENLINVHNGSGFTVTKTSQVCEFDDSKTKPDAATITFEDGAKYHNLDTEASCYFGDSSKCAYWTCWQNVIWGDVLMIGIHGGYKAQYIVENKNVTSLDVVDDNQDLIDYVDYIDNSITVTHTSDMSTYDSIKKYDLIIVQCHHWPSDYTSEIKNNLKTHYSSLLKEGGSVVVPIINKVL